MPPSRNRGSASSGEFYAKAFPHDIVELRASAQRSKNAQWQWRGQVLRTAGYDDGEGGEDLPAGHCTIFWLGRGLEQWPSALVKESSIRVIDRPWVLGDRVARWNDPLSLGTIIGVNCWWRLSRGETLSAEVCANGLRPVGGFRAEDWVASESFRWVGKIEEAVYRIEVELCRGKNRPRSRVRNRRKPPVCAFQVSSEGLQGLEPATGDDVTPQELSPHFPGQRVRAPAKLWRQAEWIRGGLTRRYPRRGTPIRGVVTSVECYMLAVRWLAGASRDSHPPDEWVGPETVRLLSMTHASEGWALGDHVADTASGRGAAVIAESRSEVDVKWADGTVEERVSALYLCPRPHISAHDFLPYDFVSKTAEDIGQNADGYPSDANYTQQDSVVSNSEPHPPRDYSSYFNSRMQERERALRSQQQEDAIVQDEEFSVDAPLATVASVNMEARTAIVEWAPQQSRRSPSSAEEVAGRTEEVSVFELAEHPQVDVRLGDAVLVPSNAEAKWVGRVCALRTSGHAQIEALDGSMSWQDVRTLVVVDDGGSSVGSGDEGGEVDDASDDGASESGSSLSEESEGDSPMDNGEGQEPAGLSASQNPWRGALRQVADVARRLKESGAPGVDFPWFPTHRVEAEVMQSMLPGTEHVAAVVEARLSGRPRVDDDESFWSATVSADPCEPASIPAPAPDIQPFDMCGEDVEPADHHFLRQESPGSRTLMMAVRREMMVLKKGLLEGPEGVPAPIIVRTFSTRSDLFRAMVVGPPDTPYSDVPFFFDFALPPEYPQGPPRSFFHAHYAGNERLNPNLYVDGKVCLSLLGTWSGPSWDPQRSTMLQVLVSLQGLVLVDEPYFNEPGHECDVGTEQGKQASALYNENARILSLRAALNVAQNPPRGFEEIVAKFFQRAGPKLVRDCQQALEGPDASKSSAGFRKVLAKMLPRLHSRWGGDAASSSVAVSQAASASSTPAVSAEGASDMAKHASL